MQKKRNATHCPRSTNTQVDRVSSHSYTLLHTQPVSCQQQQVRMTYVAVYTGAINIYTFILERCSLSGLEPFFGDFSAARPRLAARLAPSDSPQPRGPCPRAGPIYTMVRVSAVQFVRMSVRSTYWTAVRPLGTRISAVDWCWECRDICWRTLGVWVYMRWHDMA